jgi:phosphatidylinositol-3-phosphatase
MRICAALSVGLLGLCWSMAVQADTIPRYDHIFVILEENRSLDEIIGSSDTPELTRLAKTYGLASNFFAIRHPSEPNYVVLVGGDTFGIRDDDAFYCVPGKVDPGCGSSSKPGYVDHTVAGDNLTLQLSKAGLSWKGYFESLPEPGSLAYHAPSPQAPVAGQPDALYAVKHNGFMTFKSVQDDPTRAEKIVGFDVLEHDIAAGTLPNFAHIVPNQCNDMHGLKGHDVPSDCASKTAGLLPRADKTAGKIVSEIMQSAQWRAPGNSAIVISFDEGDKAEEKAGGPLGCCGTNPTDPDHPGGGHIPTIVITNHGPHGLQDPTPYNHYSLLRTIEDAFGIKEHLGHAADTDKGVASMTPLFAVTH